MKVIAKRKWRVVDARPPQGPLPRVIDARTVQPSAVRDGIIEAPLARACDQAGSVRELVTWEVAQKGFFNQDFGGAVVNGRRNVLSAVLEAYSGLMQSPDPQRNGWSGFGSTSNSHPATKDGLRRRFAAVEQRVFRHAGLESPRGPVLEGLIPGVSDHGLAQYVDRIASHIG